MAVVTDTIADMLTRIRNANQMRYEEVQVPASNIKIEIAKILKEEGIRVPEDLSITSVDNTDLAVLGDVMLTSMPYPMEKLGECAAENLMKMIKNSGFDGNYEFPMQIVERDSVKDLNRNK